MNLKKIVDHAAGIDIGAEKIFIATENQKVQVFNTFTIGYLEAIGFLRSENILTVAMEATGVYWIPLYDMLEDAGFKVFLVNGAHVKNVPGRKSDVKDCQWIQQLHSYGLLRSSFIPTQEIRELRTFTRLREDHIESSVRSINHIHKALDLMNIKLQYVISQIQGTSGMRIVRAILAGEFDPALLSELCETQILKKKKNEVIESLKGNYKKEYLFLLRSAVETYDFFGSQIEKCDLQIGNLLNSITQCLEKPEKSISEPKPIRHHKPNIQNFHEKIFMMTSGRDVSQIVGLTDLSVMKLLAEVGTNVDAWKTEKHFTSWLGLAPNIHQSGNTRKRKGRRPKTLAGQIFREAATSIGQSKYLALGGFYRRIKARSGAMVANVATARKIAVLFYNTLKFGSNYVEEGLLKYEERYKEQMQKGLMKKAEKLGFQLVPILAK